MGSNPPSFHHAYVTSLLTLAHAMSGETMFLLMSPNRDPFLQALRNDTVSLTGHDDPSFDIAEIQSFGVRLAERPAVVIKLPLPTQFPKTHFVAIVLQKTLNGPIRKSDLEGAGVDFITLEELQSDAEVPTVLLRSWEIDGTHRDRETAPAATLDAFQEGLNRIYASS